MSVGTPTEIQYRVAETAVTLSGDALTPGEPVTVTAGTTANIDNYLPVDLTILKVDSNGMTTPLKGAVFTIQQINETSTVLSLVEETLATAETTGDVEGETGTDGIARFTGLKAGYYIIKETKLPAGYVQTDSGCFYVRVENGAVALVEKDEAGVWQESEGNARLLIAAADASNPATVTVGNEAGVALPSTGGYGTDQLYLLGSMLVMLAGAGFILLQRKKRVG